MRQKLLLASVAASVLLWGAERKQLSLASPILRAELPADPGQAVNIGYAKDGSKWLITAEDVSRRIPRLYLSRPGRTQAIPVSLSETVNALGPECQLIPRLSVDTQGDAWLPAACRQGRELTFGLIRASEGAGIVSVVLNPPAEARHVAVGRDGTLYVLGVDAGFFRGTAADC